MFLLFVGSLMPLTLNAPFGFVLPPIFAVGTAMPYLLFAGLAVGFGLDRRMVRKTKRWGLAIQRMAGIFFLLLNMDVILESADGNESIVSYLIYIPGPME
ncbi:hypothetical protein [Paenibacillus alkalitolerans]|uniref:hypothetical protein n=1 Tax=Paenibacillus alkalitolerans TaxID=2799335 RepID=UPI0018F2EAA7|nr:hypothetical protein [Paenibacillus alkalitolerans]